jgi:hypothetical protein
MLTEVRLVLAHWRERYNAQPHKAPNWQAS